MNRIKVNSTLGFVLFSLCLGTAPLKVVAQEGGEEEVFVTDDIAEEIEDSEFAADDLDIEDGSSDDSGSKKSTAESDSDDELDSDDEFDDDEIAENAGDDKADEGDSEEKDEFAEFDEEEKKPEEKTPALAEETQPEPVEKTEEAPVAESEPEPVPTPEPEPVTPPVVEEVTPLPPSPAEPITPPLRPTNGFDATADLEYEAYLHDIYVNFYNSSTSAKEWETLIAGKDSEVYRIREGDTLWEVSETFFGDGNYWPKVWAVNSQFTNPHRIEPGQKVYFVLGDVNDAPYFTVSNVEPEDEVIQVDDKEEVEIPPTSRRTRPVLQNLPPSIPEWQSISKTQRYDDLGISYGVRGITKKKNSKYLTNYITQRKPASLGFVAEVETHNQMSSNDQFIYVYLNGGRENIGETFLVATASKRKKGAYKKKKFKGGYNVQVQGEITPVSLVADKSGGGRTLFRALVTRAINPVTPKSFILKTKLRRVLIDMKGPRSDLVAEIIGSNHGGSNPVYGTDSIVYLNRGAEDGARVGHILQIRSKRTTRKPKTIVAGNSRLIGWIKIIHTSSVYSTGVIVKSWDEVFPGDLTGRGDLLSRASFSEEPETGEEEFFDFVDKDDDVTEIDEDFDDNLGEEEFFGNTGQLSDEDEDFDDNKKSAKSNSGFQEEDLEDLEVGNPEEFDSDFEEE